MIRRLRQKRRRFHAELWRWVGAPDSPTDDQEFIESSPDGTWNEVMDWLATQYSREDWDWYELREERLFWEAEGKFWDTAQELSKDGSNPNGPRARQEGD